MFSETHFKGSSAKLVSRTDLSKMKVSSFSLKILMIGCSNDLVFIRWPQLLVCLRSYVTKLLGPHYKIYDTSELCVEVCGRGGSLSDSTSDYGSSCPGFDSNWELGFFLVSFSSLFFLVCQSVVRPESGPSQRCNTTVISKEKWRLSSAA